MKNMQKPICIIPARAGSKRIKNKNIIYFMGKPIIAYSILLAIRSKLFKKIVVSTDCKKIKKISEKYGAEVPFLRSKKLSDDHTGTDQVIRDCIKNLKSEKDKYHFCIYPNSTLLKKKDLVDSFKKIKKLKFDRLISVGKFNSSPLRAFKRKKNHISYLNKKYIFKRSQDLPSHYFDAGNFYIYRTTSVLKNKSIPKKTTFYLLNNTVDVNYKNDLKLLKFFFKSQK